MRHERASETKSVKTFDLKIDSYSSVLTTHNFPFYLLSPLLKVFEIAAVMDRERLIYLAEMRSYFTTPTH